MPPSPRHDGPRRRLDRAFTIGSWAAAAVLLGLSACWIISGWSWSIDLAANLTAQWLGVCAGAGALWAALRRWGPAGAAAGACLLCLIGLGTGRAAFLPREVGSAARATPGLVRFMHYNASAQGEGERIEEHIRLSDADVVSIVCPPNRFQDAVANRGRLDGDFAGKLVRHWKPEVHGGDYTEVTAGFLVSRWPVRAADRSWLGEAADYLIAGVVERPEEQGGAFAVVAFHPRSPRTAGRWALGNVTTHAAALLVNRLREQGLAVVVLTDLNSTPSGYRSRMLAREAGLRRSKPLLAATGTYPIPLSLRERGDAKARVLWPVGIAIDDLLVSEGVEVVGWSVGPRMESGHLPIVAELIVPGRSLGKGAGTAEDGDGSGR